MADASDMIGNTGRRQFLQAALGGLVIGVSPSALRLLPAPRIEALRSLSPDDALAELLAGNQRFVAGRLTSFHQDLGALRSGTVNKQQPFAAVLGCADSRVPVELVFDQSIGQLFVARVAGNFVTPEIVASLEYGVAALHVRTVLVLGHSHCGAVTAAMKGEPEPGQISALYPALERAVEDGAGNLDTAIAANARLQANLLRRSSTVIRQAISAGTLRVASGVYDLASGKVAVG